MLKKIYIEITNICNLNCKFCPDTNRTKKNMTANEFKEIISKIHKYTNMVCLHVKGEPLMHPELENILEILDNYNLKANITTNGTLINKNADILKNSKAIKQINFSIHSITQNKSMQDEYLNNIFKIVVELPKTVNVSYRLWNISELKQNQINTDIIKQIEKQYNLTNLQDKLKENEFYKIDDNVFINQDTEFTWPDINGEPIIENGRCLALKEQIAILVDGTVVPCCLDNNGDIPLGNVLEDSFESILDNEFSKRIKRNFENSIITCELCKTCGFLKRLEEKRKKLEKLT